MKPWPVFWLVVLGVLSGLGGHFLAFVEATWNSGARVTEQYPAPGEVCTADPSLRCAENADCTQSDNCECIGGKFGSGTFVCYNNGDTRLEVQGQQLKTWTDCTITVIWPCVNCLTAFETVGSGSVDVCKIQVFGIFDILAGRNALRGTEVFIVVKLKSGFTQQIAFRITGMFSDSKYTFREQGKLPDSDQLPGLCPPNTDTTDVMDGSGSGDGDSSDSDDEDDNDEEAGRWGPPQTLRLPDGDVIRSYVGSDNFVYVVASSCGLLGRFRPPGDGPYDGDAIPGLSLALDEQSGYTAITFPNSKKCLVEALPTNASGQTIPQAIGLQVLLENGCQLDRPGSRDCVEAGDAYKACIENRKDKNNDTVACSEFLADQDLVQCIHEGPSPQPLGSRPSAISLYTKCIKYTCDIRPKPFASCYFFYKAMKKSNCPRPSEFEHLQCY